MKTADIIRVIYIIVIVVSLAIALWKKPFKTIVVTPTSQSEIIDIDLSDFYNKENKKIEDKHILIIIRNKKSYNK